MSVLCFTLIHSRSYGHNPHMIPAVDWPRRDTLSNSAPIHQWYYNDVSIFVTEILHVNIMGWKLLYTLLGVLGYMTKWLCYNIKCISIYIVEQSGYLLCMVCAPGISRGTHRQVFLPFFLLCKLQKLLIYLSPHQCTLISHTFNSFGDTNHVSHFKSIIHPPWASFPCS